jgi:hypothetical protein
MAGARTRQLAAAASLGGLARLALLMLAISVAGLTAPRPPPDSPPPVDMQWDMLPQDMCPPGHTHASPDGTECCANKYRTIRGIMTCPGEVVACPSTACPPGMPCPFTPCKPHDPGGFVQRPDL